MARFASVRTAYYKHDEQAKDSKEGKRKKTGLSLLDHIRSKRDGVTNSPNVHDIHTHKNFGEYYHGGDSQYDSYMALRATHEKQIGKRIRADFNALFEHIIVLSVEQVEILEKLNSPEAVRKFLLNASKDYAKAVKKKWGFMPIGVDWHMDEGYHDKETGKFIRNVHAHLTFYNRDFEKKKAPLRELAKKNVNNEFEKTPDLNPNFEWMQDQVATCFKKGGFVRGISYGAENRKHLNKQAYLEMLERKVIERERKLQTLSDSMDGVEKSLRERLSEILKPMVIALRDSVNEIEPKRTRQIKMALGALEEIKPELPAQTTKELDEVVKMIEPIQQPRRRM